MQERLSMSSLFGTNLEQLSLFIPFLLGGWTGLLWGGLVRMFLSNHAAWSVNSVCHTFGRRKFQTNDRSRNQWAVALLGLGEGWHNNHHAFPRSAFHGPYWWQVDISGYVIWLLERLSLIHNVQRISPELLERRMYRQR
jgi:stearoyl-CoA desaturase (Delta-9 desaturase)